VGKVEATHRIGSYRHKYSQYHIVINQYLLIFIINDLNIRDNRLWVALGRNHLLQKAPCGFTLGLRGQEEGDGLARFVHSAIEGAALALDRERGGEK
jgi:hypothetical protein